MINISYALININGKWQKIDPKDINEHNLNGLIIKTTSGKVFVINERKK